MLKHTSVKRRVMPRKRGYASTSTGRAADLSEVQLRNTDKMPLLMRFSMTALFPNFLIDLNKRRLRNIIPCPRMGTISTRVAIVAKRLLKKLAVNSLKLTKGKRIRTMESRVQKKPSAKCLKPRKVKHFQRNTVRKYREKAKRVRTMGSRVQRKPSANSLKLMKGLDCKAARKIFFSLPSDMDLKVKRKHLRQRFLDKPYITIWTWCKKFESERITVRPHEN